ncbi:MAG: PEP/pyruvate-binding domain-containing protein, partial [Candidatus Fermentibacteraceae bacterium]
KTWYITSDAIVDFVHHNALEELLSIKYSDPSEIRQEHIYLRQIFKNSLLPTEIMAGLSMALDDLGDVPLVVRSSSLLEDSTGAAFAGKYRSLFVANRGSKEERLDALADAVLEVYASVFGPDPIEYRRERGLLDFNEEMGILIQEVVGHRLGDYYFPAFAGVAFSQNDFRWSPRIRRDDGIIRLVTGLGTRAVDRVGDDFPVLVSPGKPGLRPNVTVDETIRHAQKSLDVINLKTRRFETVSFQELFDRFGSDYPTLSYIISLEKDGRLQPPMGTLFNVEREHPVVTFERLISNSPFILLMKTVLDTLQEEIGMPVDVEFAYADDIQVPYLLQCRPQSHGVEGLRVEFPREVPQEDVLFTADRYVTTAETRGIEYLVYVDPLEYDLLDSREKLINVGRLIGRINEKLPQKRFVLMGPGRWGSRGDIKMGVQVGYSDINRTAILIEIARSKKGYVPDLSFGTHFFQDLVEAGIRYLPLYPDSEGVVFNEEFFDSAHNCLPKMVPGSRELAHVVKVIRVEREVSDATVTVLMDGDTERAMAYLDRG